MKPSVIVEAFSEIGAPTSEIGKHVYMGALPNGRALLAIVMPAKKDRKGKNDSDAVWVPRDTLTAAFVATANHMDRANAIVVMILVPAWRNAEGIRVARWTAPDPSSKSTEEDEDDEDFDEEDSADEDDEEAPNFEPRQFDDAADVMAWIVHESNIPVEGTVRFGGDPDRGRPVQEDDDDMPINLDADETSEYFDFGKHAKVRLDEDGVTVAGVGSRGAGAFKFGIKDPLFNLARDVARNVAAHRKGRG